jgi:hypothetical protein
VDDPDLENDDYKTTLSTLTKNFDPSGCRATAVLHGMADQPSGCEVKAQAMARADETKV